MRRLICAFVVRIWHKTRFRIMWPNWNSIWAMSVRIFCLNLDNILVTNEPQLDKINKIICVQQRLRSAWASTESDQSSLSTWRNLWSLGMHWAHSEDSDQTGRMTRLICVFAGLTGHFVCFVVLRLKCENNMKKYLLFLNQSCYSD